MPCSPGAQGPRSAQLRCWVRSDPSGLEGNVDASACRCLHDRSDGGVVHAATPFGVASAARAQTPEVLQGPRHGETAVQQLGGALAEVAANNHKTPAELTRLLRTDRDMWLDEHGQIFVKDSFVPPAAPAAATEDGPFPNAQTFQLHSRPGAARVIYLDFDGQVVSGTAWGVSTDPQPAFDMDGSPTTWSQPEIDVIQSVFQRVSEDYAPFDVDVTTQEPGFDALNRASAADQNFGTRVLITPSLSAHQSLCGGTCGGVAFLGVYNDIDNTYYQPAWVFSNTMQDNPKYIAEAASHEAGHNLGLPTTERRPSATTPGTTTGRRSWASATTNRSRNGAWASTRAPTTPKTTSPSSRVSGCRSS